LNEVLEQETERWAFLEAVESVGAPSLASLPEGGDGAVVVVPRRVDAELRTLAAMREQWDDLLGQLAMLVSDHRLWRDMGFASLAHYGEERLGMAARTLGQRVWLARRLCQLPSLREAVRGGRISYEKARILAGADDGCAGDAAVAKQIDRAERMTCIALRREAEATLDAQMRARRVFRALVPRRVGGLLAAAFRAARNVAGRWLPPEECLLLIAQHFIETYESLPAERSAPQRRAIERDRHCQVPGCSRPAGHAHHIIPRSQGGPDEDWNLVGLCPAHHLHGVHRGWVRVRGRAPDALVWELGEMEVEASAAA